MGDLKIDPEFKEFAGALRLEEREQLEQNLLRDGRALDPLIAWRTKGGLILVDGHHRLDLCTQHHLPFDVHELEFDSRDAVLVWIGEHQAGRRNWTDSAWKYHIGKLHDARKRQGARNDLTSGQSGPRLSEQIAKEKGLGERTVRRAADFARAVDQIAEIAGPVAKTRILDELMDVSREDVIKLASQPATIRQVFAEDTTPTGGRLRQALRDAKRDDRNGGLDELGTPPADGSWPKFAVLLADPPWEYHYNAPWGNAEETYSTMDLGAIIALRQSLYLDAHLTDDAALFLWATQPNLPMAFELMAAWGFEYKAGLVWHKPRVGLGNYVRGEHELLLLGIRGSLTPLESSRPRSVFEGEPWCRLHSAKPDKAYEIIESMYPAGARLELFARQRRPGWVAWGNEVPVREEEAEAS